MYTDLEISVHTRACGVCDHKRSRCVLSSTALAQQQFSVLTEAQKRQWRGSQRSSKTLANSSRQQKSWNLQQPPSLSASLTSIETERRGVGQILFQQLRSVGYAITCTQTTRNHFFCCWPNCWILHQVVWVCKKTGIIDVVVEGVIFICLLLLFVWGWVGACVCACACACVCVIVCARARALTFYISLSEPTASGPSHQSTNASLFTSMSYVLECPMYVT